jgi:hypothetical protein
MHLKYCPSNVPPNDMHAWTFLPRRFYSYLFVILQNGINISLESERDNIDLF